MVRGYFLPRRINPKWWKTPSAMTERYYRGRGTLNLGPRNVGGQPETLTPIGNCTSLVIRTEQEFVDYRESASGKRRRLFSIPVQETVSLTMTLENVQRANWQIAILGDYQDDFINGPGTETIFGLNTTGIDWWLTFGGLNTAEGNNPVLVDVYKCRFRPVPELPLLNEDLLAFELEADVFYDPLNSDYGGYFRITQNQAVVV